MITNPVYNREMKVSARSIRLPLILAAFNLILAVFALASMAATINQARSDAQINYAEFLTIFKYVATIEFAMVLFIMPAMTSGSISGERERGTLDLMLTTKLTPARIVIGKLLTNMSNVIIVLVSSFPVLALVFAYGGVTVKDFIVLMISFITVSFLTAAIGMCASSICRRSTIATAVSYIAVLVLVGGTIGINILVYNFTGSAGKWIYLLLANPAVTFYSSINAMTGNRYFIADLAAQFNTSIGLDSGVWFTAGTLVQLAVGILLVAVSVKSLSPGKKG
ncbi:MAG: ABC transporter permease subunit [Lachnospiraceae bacterium]|nr:ABC transporter permease subunit [Lachnospiraceae bacterium]